MAASSVLSVASPGWVNFRSRAASAPGLLIPQTDMRRLRQHVRLVPISEVARSHRSRQGH